MPLIKRRNPWHYNGMIHDPTLNLLYKKQYKDIKTRDFFNMDYKTIPMFVDPAKLYLYRYLKFEPYLHEICNLKENIHPVHPLHPTTDEVIGIYNKCFYSTRSPMKFPLKKKRRRRRRKLDIDLETEMLTAYFEAGASETDSCLSPGELTDWSSDDFESGSEQSLKSWHYTSKREECKDKKKKEKCYRNKD